MSYKSTFFGTLASATLSLLAAPVFADSHGGGHSDNHFEGAYVVLSNEWKSASVTVDGEKISKSENAPSVGIGYNFALDADTTLGLKLTADTKNGEYGSGEVTSGEKVIQEKSHYSVALEPGYVVNDKTLVFGILAYHSAKAEIEGGSNARVSGFGYGLGAKYTFADHWFLISEYQHVDYGSKTIDDLVVKPKSNVFSLGIGYHF